MKFHASFLTILAVSASALLAGTAQAAVMVVGKGPATSCYQAAENNGPIRDGIEVCTLALETQAMRASDRAATYVNRGILRSRSGDANGALRDYNQGLAVDDKVAEGYVDRGATLIVMQRYQDAIADINKGLSLGTQRPYIAYYDRGVANEALGNVREAYEDYKKAVSIEPGFTLASEQLPRFKVVRKGDSSM